MTVSGPATPDAWWVSCDLTFELATDAVLAVQVAPSRTAGHLVEETFEATIDGSPLRSPPTELAVDHGGRVHLVSAESGTLAMSYRAGLKSAHVVSTADDGCVFDAAAIAALRPSRYCPSDALAGFATRDIRLAAGDTGSVATGLIPGPDLARSVAAWVFERLAYEPGATGHLDTAVDALLAGAGVCRDFAHLTIALCRALGVPARMVAVYAPGLSPMDFHAVVEARRGGGWELLDPTRLAPRSSLVRIATGHDAADTAFATTLRGEAELTSIEVSATIDGDLPADDHWTAISLP